MRSTCPQSACMSLLSPKTPQSGLLFFSNEVREIVEKPPDLTPHLPCCLLLLYCCFYVFDYVAAVVNSNVVVHLLNAVTYFQSVVVKLLSIYCGCC